MYKTWAMIRGGKVVLGGTHKPLLTRAKVNYPKEEDRLIKLGLLGIIWYNLCYIFFLYVLLDIVLLRLYVHKKTLYLLYVYNSFTYKYM